MPEWLHVLSIIGVIAGFGCALAVAVHVAAHPQHMWIMNVVWPVTALFGTVLTLWLYFRYGTLATKERMREAKQQGKEPPAKQGTPFPVMVAKGASHCGSGCCLGDIAAEWLAFAVPSVAVWFGWHSLFAERIFAVWVLDFLFAFVLGVAFQYFTIEVNTPEFWFMMQLAMLCGFATSYPVNWWLIKSGIKEKM